MLATLLPGITLIIGVVLLLMVNMCRDTNTPKTFFTLAKYIIIITALMTIIFYNKSTAPLYIENTEYTTLFKLLTYAVALIWFYVSLKWFLSKDLNSMSFYCCGLISLIGLGMTISAVNLGIVLAGMILNFIATYYMVRMNFLDDKAPKLANRYLLFSTIFTIMFAAALVIFYHEIGSLEYAVLREHLLISRLNLQLKLAVIMVLAVFFFVMGAAPFHLWYNDCVGASILPVSGYLSLVPFIGYFACFSDVLVNVMIDLQPIIKNIMIIFGSISVVSGALGVLGEKNLRKIFAFGTLFNIGVIIIVLSPVDVKSLLSAFVFLITYILAMLGIYTAFYGFKSKGRYLIEVRDIAGVYKTKTYISAAFLVFIVSLLGMPPMLGFLGRLSVIDNLFVSRLYWVIPLILVSLLFLCSGFFKIIRTVYFFDPINKFDRADKGIYICLLFNIIMVVITLANPRFLMQGFEQILIMLFE